MIIETLARDIRIYSKALTIAYMSDYSTRVGSVLAKGNRAYAGAFNVGKNDQKNVPHGFASVHAEIAAMACCSEKELPKTTLYIARLSKVEDQMPSRPCVNCMRSIMRVGIKEIVYLDKYYNLVKERLC